MSPGDMRSLNSLLDDIRHLDLTGKIIQQSPFFKAHGGYNDVFSGKSLHHGGMQVAIKRLRMNVVESQKIAKLIMRELKIWSSLTHPNILPLLGYQMHGEYPALISQWMVNGNVLQFLKKQPDTNILSMAIGIASGLLYLHQEGVIHSDMKSDNIFVSEDREPLLADFGISHFMTSSQTFGGTSTDNKGSVRWMAIEFFDIGSKDLDTGPLVHSKESDVWAYGMVLYELLTGRRPYSQFTKDIQVALAIIHGQSPDPIPSLDSSSTETKLLWTISSKCWSQVPSHRPSMQQIFHSLTYRDSTIFPFDYVPPSAMARESSEKKDSDYELTEKTPETHLDDLNVSTSDSEIRRISESESSLPDPDRDETSSSSHQDALNGAGQSVTKTLLPQEYNVPLAGTNTSDNGRNTFQILEVEESSSAGPPRQLYSIGGAQVSKMPTTLTPKMQLNNASQTCGWWSPSYQDVNNRCIHNPSWTSVVSGN